MYKDLNPTRYVFWPQTNYINNHNKMIYGKSSNSWRLGNIFPNNSNQRRNKKGKNKLFWIEWKWKQKYHNVWGKQLKQ